MDDFISLLIFVWVFLKSGEIAKCVFLLRELYALNFDGESSNIEIGSNV